VNFICAHGQSSSSGVPSAKASASNGVIPDAVDNDNEDNDEEDSEEPEGNGIGLIIHCSRSDSYCRFVVVADERFGGVTSSE